MPIPEAQLPPSYRLRVLLTVHLVLLVALGAAFLIACVTYSLHVRLILLGAASAVAISYQTVRRGHTVLGTHLLIGTVQLLATYLALAGQGLNDIAFAIMPALLILGGLLLPLRQYFAMVAGILLSVLVVATATAAGYVKPTLVFPGLPRIWGEAAALLVILLAEAAMVYLLVVAVLQFFTESEQRQQQLLNAHAALRRENEERQQAEATVRTLNTSLEQRVQERTAELQTLVDELDAFNYSVSHDLRSPLRAIVGFSSVAADELERDPAHARQLLERVQAAGVRMNALIDDLLRLSTTSTHALHWQPVELSRLLSEIIAELPDRERQWVQLQQDPTLTSTQLSADAGLLHVALANVIGNAIKYSRQASSPKIEVTILKTANGLSVRVQDNGIGFSADQAKRLFKPFTRLENAKDFEGSGIGLAIVRRVVERHRGELQAESSPGNGACFVIALPQQQ